MDRDLSFCTLQGIRRSYREIGARQYLAAEARAIERAGRDHFKRAAIGVSIALVILMILGLLFLTPTASAAEPPTGRLVILLDRTKSLSTESFAQNVKAIGPILSHPTWASDLPTDGCASR